MIELDLEKESERKGHQTKQTYSVYLKARIVPRWGRSPLREIKDIMSEVFQHAIRYGWLNDGENPIFAVRQSTKRERVTEPLEAAEFSALMLKLPQMMRVIGIVTATTGLRISEVLGLKWLDIYWKESQMNVTRSVVDGIIGKCKTETSRRPGLLTHSPETSCWAGSGKPVMPSPRIGSLLAHEPGVRCRPGRIRCWTASCNPPA